MKKSNFTGKQIAYVLRQVVLGETASEVCRKWAYPKLRVTGGSRSTVV
jgi:hypothetical protein